MRGSLKPQTCLVAAVGGLPLGPRHSHLTAEWPPIPRRREGSWGAPHPHASTGLVTADNRGPCTSLDSDAGSLSWNELASQEDGVPASWGYLSPALPCHESTNGRTFEMRKDPGVAEIDAKDLQLLKSGLWGRPPAGSSGPTLLRSLRPHLGARPLSFPTKGPAGCRTQGHFPALGKV